jgi:hypothetical protein
LPVSCPSVRNFQLQIAAKFLFLGVPALHEFRCSSPFFFVLLKLVSISLILTAHLAFAVFFGWRDQLLLWRLFRLPPTDWLQ